MNAHLPRMIIESFTEEDLALLRERLKTEQDRTGYMNSKSAAEYLSIGRRRLYALIQRGDVKVYRDGRALKFKAEDLDAVLRRSR